jgi:hypothetical protein
MDYKDKVPPQKYEEGLATMSETPFSAYSSSILRVEPEDVTMDTMDTK